MSDDIRIILIKENGNIVVIFSSENYICDNVIEITETDNINKILKYYEKIKDKVYKNKDMADKHLFYLKDYLKTNFNEQFDNIKINPQSVNDDILLYYLLSQFNNIVMVNSTEHIDIAVMPNNDLNNLQYNSLLKTLDLFDNNIRWSFCDNMHFDIIEDNGKKYKILNIGEPQEGNLSDLVLNYKPDSKGKKM